MNIELNTCYDSRPEAKHKKTLIIKVGNDAIELPWGAAKQLPHEIEKHLASDFLTIEEVAAMYGKKVTCKMLDPTGNDWASIEMTVNSNFIKEMEQKSIKNCQVVL